MYRKGEGRVNGGERVRLREGRVNGGKGGG
jgi:hypothetical protein